MAKDQKGGDQQAYSVSTAESSSENQKRDQRARLIKALSRFKPRDANPLQFYNCVRELCIMHNCSIDEGLERAALTWPGLSMRQRELYDSQRHAELPIPVPRHLIYRAFQKESKGLWSLGRSSVGGKRTTRYTLESYKPPPKPSRIRSALIEKRPKYDNLLDLPPKEAARRVPPAPNRKFSRVSPSSGRRIRNLTPSPVVRSVRSIQKILSMASVQMKKSRRRRQRVKKVITPEPLAEKSTPGGSKLRRKKTTVKRKGPPSGGSKVKRSFKEGDELKTVHNWDLAIGCVRRRLTMHQPLKTRS
ncbi:uncharacterized protein LOC128264855 [Drosophila gunungcola]|uniref:Uncharacterized protein n=1 Tax=Drosophila gunungcola TaxID=103775 RepID=A0A9P9YBU0_9MUSC|nr:uncharacterized protein LOC128264855 [Drosophila gunungcola]KAI8034068.1 hypothetical protein M5D96_013147 [Drosophila gunungcola]